MIVLGRGWRGRVGERRAMVFLEGDVCHRRLAMGTNVELEVSIRRIGLAEASSLTVG
jgi:hypothetical protein